MELSIEVEITCDSCGGELDARITNHRGYQTLLVDPCDTCLTDAADKAASNAKEEADSTIEDLKEQLRELLKGED